MKTPLSDTTMNELVHLSPEDKRQLAKMLAADGEQSNEQPGEKKLESFPTQPATDIVQLRAPDRVLWLNAEKQPVVVSVGEPAILSAPGGTGKSYMTLALLMAAADKTGEALGFGIRPGPALYVSYEDSPARIGQRLKAILDLDGRKEEEQAGNGLDRLHVACDIDALFEPPPGAGTKPGAVPGAAFGALRARIEKLKPSIVVVDPVSGAAGAVSLNDATGARTVMRTLGFGEQWNGKYG